MKSIAVIGQGFVGGSLTTVFAERGFDVYAYDKAGRYVTGAKIPPSILTSDEMKQLVSGTTFDHGQPVLKQEGGMYTVDLHPKSIDQLVMACSRLGKAFSGVYFVCVPTPMYEDGEADLSIVESVLSELADACELRFTSSIAVVKSTVPPGSCERWNQRFNAKGLRIVFNPEFLTEANALNDMRNQDRIILGGPRPHINTVKLVFQSAFPGVPVVKTSSTTAEMVKYTINCFLATKVAFANELSQIVEALDESGLNVDYDKVVEYAKLDKRLGNSHWAVPGPVPTHDGRYVRGFGGHCFPKDINALMVVAKQLGVEPRVLRAAWEKNLEVRGPEDRDWERMTNRAVSKRK